ncbi:NF045616 family extracytoplasmic (lipo)protein [Acinetobacter shaoyimingii]|uniref:Uncharacterized protein n=1 Tax=Acinetobacter shaoyimingii TaxID=2715164 RepID=A0A6G8RZR7_9GAMM|nr:NF045616 family extracytoplasmic (lipo)protein [Acinetobacter shaoyimingii]QIO07340.1 hypothetical protein G8E00_16030 [Acinetobacter shaoyimingii]
MKKQYFILIVLLIFSNHIKANSPGTKPLFAHMKNGNLCVFTQDDKAILGYENRAYVYTTNLDETTSRTDDYEKIYYNIKVPKDLDNCISIPIEKIEKNKPHDIFIELDKTYSLRICISETKKIYSVDQFQKCSNELYKVESKSGNSIFDTIMNYFKKMISYIFDK